MILVPAAAERNTRTVAEGWLDSGFRIQDSGAGIQNSEFRSSISGIIRLPGFRDLCAMLFPSRSSRTGATMVTK